MPNAQKTHVLERMLGTGIYVAYVLRFFLEAVKQDRATWKNLYILYHVFFLQDRRRSKVVQVTCENK